MRRLVLFVEGEGEADAVPVLVRRLLTEKGEWHDILLDDGAVPGRLGRQTGERGTSAIGSASWEPASSGPTSAGCC